MSSLVASSKASPDATAEKQAAKKTRGGRKNKTSQWRKDIDLDDVEDGLEERREEERQGGTIEERQDADLFVVDAAGDAQERARQKRKKKLRLDEVLGKRSGVKVPVIGSKMSEDRRRRKEEHALRQRLKKVAGLAETASTSKAQGIKAKAPAADYDIWGMPGPTTPAESAQALAGGKQSTKRRGNVTREKLKHLSMLPAVDVAHPGASYMPTEKDHKELVGMAETEYVGKIRAAEKYKHVSTKNTVDPIDSMNECAEIVMRELDADIANDQGTADDGSDSNSDAGSGPASDDDDADNQARTSSDPRRKTRVERNRQRKAAQKLFEERNAKDLKKHLHQLEMSRRLGGKVDTSLEKAEVVADTKRKQADERAKQPLKRIGKNSVPETPIAVKLTEELPRSLRELAPETNGFAEVYNSLVRRNFIEPPSSKRARKIVAKTKTTEKWSYKDFV
ncbi:hypothetical protein GGI11_005867 [Coemansia sp. RSA 2049]|nr:hypothetical protein GGI11_005867 [Coemansia sp. RSA 2049]KAJ2517216.1 hypothetical protein H4217_004104 [Coemansia sp. RSA 1939]KAJ2615768.1 hypothetical protein EV177_001414 [Coemansia sp. RSA 1804]